MVRVSATSARLTPDAAMKLKELHDGDSDPILHLYMAGQSCCGVQYGISFVDDIEDGYAVSELAGVRLVVDPVSLPHCEDAVVDFVETPEGSGFKVDSPRNGGTCGCAGS